MDKKIVEEQVIMVIKTVLDPEIPVNIYELGLIYEINLKENKEKYDAEVIMTLTSPNCPVAESMPEEVRTKVNNLENINECNVHIVFDPPWNSDHMSDEAKLELGIL